MEKVLGDIRSRAVPYAQRNTINDMAFDAMRGGRGNVRSDFINRNTWTVRTISANKARRTGDYAEVGSSEGYMRKQENGGRGEKYIATGNTSGETARTVPRKRPIKRSLWINKLQVAKARYESISSHGMNMRQLNIAALKAAKKNGERYVIMDKGRGRGFGLYQVLGTKKKPKSRILYKILKAQSRIKSSPWLKPASEKASKMGATYYFAQMRKELARIKPL